MNSGCSAPTARARTRCSGLARTGKGLVAPGHHVAGGLGALVHQHGLDRLAATHGQAFVDDGLERQFLAAAHLVVGGDHGHGAGVDDAFLQRLGREAAKHHAVRGADARAGLHGNHALDRHGHVDQHAVALLDALAFSALANWLTRASSSL
jgi:hypothetical protein